jgi:ABC-type uncharacterized transport system involved in gliding motility auxiliary subunit
MARSSVTPDLLQDEIGWLSRESTRRFMLMGVEVVFLLLIAISIEVIVARVNARFDLTPEKQYSLSALTNQALHALNQPVQVTIFYRRGDREKYDELLGLMTQETHFLT